MSGLDSRYSYIVASNPGLPRSFIFSQTVWKAWVRGYSYSSYKRAIHDHTIGKDSQVQATAGEFFQFHGIVGSLLSPDSEFSIVSPSVGEFHYTVKNWVFGHMLNTPEVQ